MEERMAYSDIDPMDIDPETNRPYAGYSSASLDTSFHDGEMDVDDVDDPVDALKAIVAAFPPTLHRTGAQVAALQAARDIIAKATTK
jgi:hypothetical protein